MLSEHACHTDYKSGSVGKRNLQFSSNLIFTCSLPFNPEVSGVSTHLIYLLHKTSPTPIYPPTHTQAHTHSSLVVYNKTKKMDVAEGVICIPVYPANEGCAVAYSHPASATHCTAYCG